MRIASNKIDSAPFPVKVGRYEPPAHLPLLAAQLCVEPSCETVFDASHQDVCPRCGSHATYPLTRWLNRISRETKAKVIA